MKNIFKYASLLAAAVMLVSCQGTIDPSAGNGSDGILKIASDKNILQAKVDKATITVTLDGEVITEDIVFFDGENKPIKMDGFEYVAPSAGDHVIWASYGTYISDEITIRAIDIPIPATPEDPNPSSTSFKARVLMTEFTTTGCGYCPNMKKLLHDAFADKAVADKVVLTACHSNLVNKKPDPAYIKTGFDVFCNATNFPCVNIDMYSMFSNYNASLSDFKAMVNTLHSGKEQVAAGLAVNSSVKDGSLVAKVTVKSAKDATYRIGALLVEDGIYGVQSGGAAESWMNTHDGVIRYFDCQYYNKSGGEQYYGYSVGNVKKGETADYVFAWNLDNIWAVGCKNGNMYGGVDWDPFVMDNLHLVVFTTTIGEDEKGDQYYYINNVIDCPINGNTPFEYR